jgi:hypothetical protein
LRQQCEGSGAQGLDIVGMGVKGEDVDHPTILDWRRRRAPVFNLDNVCKQLT